MFKKNLRKIHLWLGLVVGLLVFIIAITGCIYVFQNELQDLTQPYRFVEKEPTHFLLPSELKAIAEKQLPGKPVHSIKYFKEDRAAVAIFYEGKPANYYYQVFLNPYTGSVLHVKNMDTDFFNVVLKGHRYLWLPKPIGRVVVMIATLIFTIMVISGIVLWFPKNWNVFKKRAWFQWKSTTQWKRKNWDLHGIMGFYVCLFALAFVITGLVYSIPGYGNLYHKIIGGKKSMTYYEPNSNKAHTTPKVNHPVDKLFLQYLYSDKNYANIDIHDIESDSSSILVVANPSNTTYYQSDYVFHDQFTLAEIPVNHVWSKRANATTADKVLRMNYDIHVGAIMGLPTKFIAFFASLFIASLPVTGFLIWYGKKKKKPYRRKEPQLNWEMQRAN